MNTGHFYYIEDQYFLDFQDSQLMKHKETVDGILHNRPVFMHLKILELASTG
jgi:hypothetical protein